MKRRCPKCKRSREAMDLVWWVPMWLHALGCEPEGAKRE